MSQQQELLSECLCAVAFLPLANVDAEKGTAVSTNSRNVSNERYFFIGSI